MDYRLELRGRKPEAYRVFKDDLQLGFIWYKRKTDEWAGWFIVESYSCYKYVGPYPRRELVAERIVELHEEV